MLLKVFGKTVSNDKQFKYTCVQDLSRGILDCVNISFALQHRQDPEAEKKKRFSNLIVTTQ